jgi:protein TonB
MSEGMSEPRQEGDSWQDRGDADLTAPRQTRWLVVALVAMIHVSVILGLIRAFAPDFTAKVADQVLSTFTVTVTTPPSPKPPPSRVPEEAGEAAEIGKKAVPREAAAPKPKIAIAKQSAPPVAGEGAANSAGARDTGQGTGAGGQGSGAGAGNGGSGQGGGGIASKAAKTAGDINSARDYPRESRDLRIGDSVTVALTVGTDGRVRNCRVHRPSRDPEADRITCRLATDRFRFRPAMDPAGNPVESVYGWQQRWFYPGQQN